MNEQAPTDVLPPAAAGWPTEKAPHARSPRRAHFARAAFIGLCAGLLAVAFRQALAAAETGRETLLARLHLHPYWGWAILPLVGLMVGSLVGLSMQRFAPEAGGSGIPHLKGVLLHLRTLTWKKLIPVKFLGGVAGIGCGLSLGREGPTVQMGAAVARALAGVLGAPESDIPQLLTAGAGAGLAAAFNAPLAGLVFVVEELHRELSSRTAAGALVATICATVVAQWLAGNTPSFEIHGLAAMPLGSLPLAAVIGVVGGLGGVVFNQSLLRMQSAAQSGVLRTGAAGTRLGVLPRWALPGVGGVVVGIVAWWLPEAVGGGHSVAERVLGGDFNVGLGALLLLLVVKLLLTTISYASGAPGGIFAPMLLLGALCGAAFAKAAAMAWPGMAAYSQVLAVLGMAAFFAGSVRAPLTGIVLVSEMTGGYDLLFPICICVLTAYLAAEALRDAPIYDALLEADLHRSGHGPASPEPRSLYMGIQSRSMLAGKTIAEAPLPAGCIVVSLERGGAAIFPGPLAVLLPGDHVSILVPGDAPEAAMQIVHLCTGM